MSIPGYQSLMQPVLQVFGASPPRHDFQRLRGYGLWGTARTAPVTYLVKAGALQRPCRAVVRITERDELIDGERLAARTRRLAHCRYSSARLISAGTRCGGDKQPSTSDARCTAGGL